MLVLEITVIGTLVVMLVSGVFLWFRAGWMSRRVFSDHATTGNAKSPEFLHGNELFYWAKERAAAIVAKNLGRPPTTAVPTELSRELHADIEHAMFPLGVEQDAGLYKIPCPEQGQGMMGVTAPEALEMAEYIQKQLPAVERQRIHDQAAVNVKRLENVSHIDFDPAQTPCPLQGADGICLAYGAHPLRCRPHHAGVVWRQREVSRPVNQEFDLDEQIVGQGAEAGLTESLAAAGRDGSVYELNGALLIALDTPNAAERWANGEDLFHSCKLYR